MHRHGGICRFDDGIWRLLLKAPHLTRASSPHHRCPTNCVDPQGFSCSCIRDECLKPSEPREKAIAGPLHISPLAADRTSPACSRSQCTYSAAAHVCCESTCCEKNRQGVLLWYVGIAAAPVLAGWPQPWRLCAQTLAEPAQSQRHLLEHQPVT